MSTSPSPSPSSQEPKNSNWYSPPELTPKTAKEPPQSKGFTPPVSDLPQEPPHFQNSGFLSFSGSTQLTLMSPKQEVGCCFKNGTFGNKLTAMKRKRSGEEMELLEKKGLDYEIIASYQACLEESRKDGATIDHPDSLILPLDGTYDSITELLIKSCAFECDEELQNSPPDSNLTVMPYSPVNAADETAGKVENGGEMPSLAPEIPRPPSGSPPTEMYTSPATPPEGKAGTADIGGEMPPASRIPPPCSSSNDTAASAKDAPSN